MKAFIPLRDYVRYWHFYSIHYRTDPKSVSQRQKKHDHSEVLSKIKVHSYPIHPGQKISPLRDSRELVYCIRWKAGWDLQNCNSGIVLKMFFPLAERFHSVIFTAINLALPISTNHGLVRLCPATLWWHLHEHCQDITAYPYSCIHPYDKRSWVFYDSHISFPQKNFKKTHF